MPGYGSDFILKGFLDSRTDIGSQLPHLGNPAHYKPDPEDALVLALSSPEQKKYWAEIFEERGSTFFSVVHPMNSLSPEASWGKGAIFAPFNSLSRNAHLGDFVTLYGFCKIGHDLKIGNYCHFASHSSVDGFSSISDGISFPAFTAIEKNTSL